MSPPSGSPKDETWPPGHFHYYRAGLDFLARFDDLRYLGVPPARLLLELLNRVFYLGEVPRPGWRRELLGALPGRLFLRLRARRIREEVRHFGGRGTLLTLLNSHGVLDGALVHLEGAYRSLRTHPGIPGKAPLLSHFVPGRRHRRHRRAVEAIYRDFRREHPEFRERLPPESDWFHILLEQARDTLDAAEVFWLASESPGGFCLTHNPVESVAFGAMGRRQGRRVGVGQHGYLYDTLFSWPRAFDVFAVWDRWTAGVIRRHSGAQVATRVVGHHGLPPRDLASRRVGPAPSVLLASNRRSPQWHGYYTGLFRSLARGEHPWSLVWKPHPAEPQEGEPLGPRVRFRPGADVYALVARSDAVVCLFSGVLAESWLAGKRALCLAHPREVETRDWCRAHGVPFVDPGEDPGERLAACLEAPPPPRVWGPDEGARASRRLADFLREVFRGRLPGAGSGGAP